MKIRKLKYFSYINFNIRHIQEFKIKNNLDNKFKPP